MAITYQKTPLEWKNEGAEPSNALKTGGFEPGMKPTADAFNYFWHNAGEVEKELQSKLSAEATERETADTTLQSNITEANTRISNLRPGAVNLFLNTADYSGDMWFKDGATVTDDIYNGTKIYRVSGNWAGYEYLIKNLVERNLIKLGDVLTCSCYAKTDNPTEIGLNFFQPPRGSRVGTLTSDWQRFSCTFTVTEDIMAATSVARGNGFHFEPVASCDSGCYVYITNLILTKGNMLVDWSPAPEDTTKSIAELQASIASEATTRETADTTLQNNITGTNTRIDNLRPGAVNLFLNSADYSGDMWYRDVATITNDMYNGTKIYRVSGAWADYGYFVKNLVERNILKVGDVLTCSCYAKTDNPETIKFQFFCPTVYGVIGDLTEEWKHFSYTFTVTEGFMAITEAIRANTVRFEPLTACQSGYYVYVANLILTKGNMIVDWSPAPEDIEEKINSNTESIAGLQTALSSETTARETADNTLQGKINIEETARQAKDNDLQNQLNTKTGYDLSDQVVYAINADTPTIAGVNAEILNDYRTREFGEESFFNGGIVPTAGNIASGDYSTAAGQCTTAIGDNSFAIGNETVASGLNSFASGGRTHALGEASHAEGGGGSSAEGLCSHAEGASTQALQEYSHSEGYATVAHRYQHAQGRCNKVANGPASATDMTGDLFIVGNGTLENRGNALRTATEGRTYGLASFLASGADYAEMWEYADGNPENEDRRGYFVTVDENNKIHIANAEDDYILGVISACPVVVGDIQSEMWKDMYLTDIYGNKLTETVDVPETIDEKTGTIIPAHTETRWILNPDYDPEQEYICREDRPEWDAVGLLGKLIVNDDGTAKVGGFCKVANGGIATNSEDKSGWRVLERLDDKHIKILYR